VTLPEPSSLYGIPCCTWDIHVVFSPPIPCVPTTLVSCHTCDLQVQLSAEGIAPQPVFRAPLLVETCVCPRTTLSDVQQHGAHDPSLLDLHTVHLQPILAQDNSGSRKLFLKDTSSQDNFSFLSTGCVKEQDWSLESTWRDGTGIPPPHWLKNTLNHKAQTISTPEMDIGNSGGKTAFLSSHFLPQDDFFFWTHSHTHHQPWRCRCSGCSHQYLHRGTERVLFRGTISCSPRCSHPCPHGGLGTIPSAYPHTVSLRKIGSICGAFAASSAVPYLSKAPSICNPRIFGARLHPSPTAPLPSAPSQAYFWWDSCSRHGSLLHTASPTHQTPPAAGGQGHEDTPWSIALPPTSFGDLFSQRLL